MLNNLTYPLYHRAKEWIRDKIISGELEPGHKIPSESQMVEQLNISRMTANRALRELAAEGYLTRVQGVGTFVADKRPHGALLAIKSISDEISEWGGKHHCKVILHREEIASREIADMLKISQRSRIFHTIMLHGDRNLPILYADRYVNPVIAPDYIQQNFQKITPTSYLVSIAPVEEAEHTIEAIIPDDSIRNLLKIKKTEPCLVVYRRTWSFGVVATSSHLIYPGSRYRLRGRFKTGPIVVLSPP